MKRLLAFLVLAACTQEPDTLAQQGNVPGLLRNPTAPLASQVDVTAERLEGEWFLRQAAFGFRNTFQSVQLQKSDDGILSLTPCDALECYLHDLKSVGRGRWMVAPSDTSSVFDAGEMWVLWMDFDDRTVAIGDPLGRHVWIMDRAEAGGADRIAAARDILKWYGYDLSKLETVQ
jgi:apolipoprotein D and lipocalin family protein